MSTQINLPDNIEKFNAEFLIERLRPTTRFARIHRGLTVSPVIQPDRFGREWADYIEENPEAKELFGKVCRVDLMPNSEFESLSQEVRRGVSIKLDVPVNAPEPPKFMFPRACLKSITPVYSKGDAFVVTHIAPNNPIVQWSAKMDEYVGTVLYAACHQPESPFGDIQAIPLFDVHSNKVYAFPVSSLVRVSGMSNAFVEVADLALPPADVVRGGNVVETTSTTSVGKEPESPELPQFPEFTNPSEKEEPAPRPKSSSSKVRKVGGFEVEELPDEELIESNRAMDPSKRFPLHRLRYGERMFIPAAVAGGSSAARLRTHATRLGKDKVFRYSVSAAERNDVKGYYVTKIKRKDPK